MKVIALFLAIMFLSSNLVESRKLGVGGIYGSEQRFHHGRGKIIEDSEEEKMITNYPKSSMANQHVMAKQRFNNKGSDSREDDHVKFKLIDGHV